MRKFLMLAALGILALASSVAQAADTLMMATTTSTNDTGLLDVLMPEFQKASGIEVKWVSTGTGKALELGKSCDADVLLVHAPGAEKKFVEEGFGTERREVMYNDFVLVGPAADPAAVKGKSVAEALKAIAAGKSVFASRGDDSGTHKLEQGLWKVAGMELPNKQEWYVSTGQGMLATIRVAAEKGGYTVTDRGTWFKYESTLKGEAPLAVLVEGDKALLNQYSVIPVATAKCPNAKAELAAKLSDWLASPAGQKAIGDFKLEGKQLFTPNAAK